MAKASTNPLVTAVPGGTVFTYLVGTIRAVVHVTADSTTATIQVIG